MLTAKQVAERLGIHVNTLKRISPKELPYFRVGKRGDRRYMTWDVDAYIAERRIIA